MPLVSMSAIAIVATLNGLIDMIMIARVIYGLADQGNLPRGLTKLNSATHTPILATAIGACAILVLALAVPLAGLGDLTARLTLVFCLVNLALIVIKQRNEAPPSGSFICPRWVPFAGFVSSALFLAIGRLANPGSVTAAAPDPRRRCPPAVARSAPQGAPAAHNMHDAIAPAR